MKIIFNSLFFFLVFFRPIFADCGPEIQQPAMGMLESNLISGLIPDIEDGYGVAFRDFNLDGYPDIYLVCFRSLNRLLINNGGIIPFIDRTIYSGLGGDLMPRGRTNLELGAAVADYDNDGRADLFLAGWGKTHKLFRNLGALQFNDVTENMDMQGVVDANQGLWLDADKDGYLDLYITDEHHANRFLLNRGNGYFRESIWTTGLTDTAVSQGACGGDFDNDGDTDIYVANWFAPDYLLINDGKGLFTPASLNLPTLVSNHNSNSAARGDIDNDGDHDLLVATWDGEVFLYRNDSREGRLTYTPVHDHPFRQVGSSVYGILLVDFNHDGWLDCFLSVKGPNRLYLNNGNGTFSEEYDTDNRNIYSTGASVADLDEDGDPDLIVSNKDAISQIYLNPTNNRNFIDIRITGVQSNRDAVGTRLYFYSSADSARRLLGMREIHVQTGYLSSIDPRVHFGTGYYKTVDLDIVFSGGKIIRQKELQAGKSYHFYEYNLLARTFYFGWSRLRFLASRASFRLNIVLALCFLLLILVYARLGLRRYHWQAVSMTTQLLTWFLVSLFVFILFRKFSLTSVLVALNSVSFVGVLIALTYSERQLILRRRRTRFRKQLQSFSDRMLTIHRNDELFSNLIQTVTQHEDIFAADLLLYVEGQLQPFNTHAEDQPLLKVDKQQMTLLLGESLIFTVNNPSFQSLEASYKFTVLLPVKKDRQLLAVIGIHMKNCLQTVNREDLQSILPIANQTAIAIENNNYIKESAEMVRELTEARLRETYLKQLEQTNRQLDQKNNELTRLFKELQEKESQLIHSEKMASLGQLVAGISHELNNPVSFLYANSQALSVYIHELQELWDQLPRESKRSHHQKFSEIVEDLKAIIHDNINGSQSVKELVLNLKNFSRLDQADWKEAHISEGLKSSLKIIQSQFKDRIKVTIHFEDDPPLYCNPGQLNQVLINLLSNAVQAINNEGTISITGRLEHEYFVLTIHDTGTGIAEEDLPKIFDPFFTTKEVNKGSGLGLSISYSIIQKHGGKIEVNSRPGEGTTFTIRLPLNFNRESLDSEHTSKTKP